MSDPLVVLITAGSQPEADELAGALVDEQLAACVNIAPGVTSVYRWEGKVKHDREWLLIVKTRQELLSEMVRRVQALHSYAVPEIIALPIVGGSESYLRWLGTAVRGSLDAVED